MKTNQVSKSHLNKKYNLLYLIARHETFSKMKLRFVIDLIIDKMIDEGYSFTERSLKDYLYLPKDSTKEIKYTLLKALAKTLSCTVEEITEPIENINHETRNSTAV